MSRSLGVGFLGAGLATQAIHLPVLAGIADRFHVVSVMDVDVGVAERVASRCGATFTTDADAIMQDPSIDVVVVCSPDAMHAAQVVAACQSGKMAVLCEKPLAVGHAEAEQASEPASPPPLPPSGEGRSDAVMLRGAVLGLAIHNLPLLRQFHPRLGDLASVHFDPSGTRSWSVTRCRHSSCSATWEEPGHRTGGFARWVAVASSG